MKNRFQALAVEEPMNDGREEEGDQVERKSEILEKAYVKTAEEIQEKEKQAMVESGNLGSDRPKKSHQTEVNQCKISETKAEMAR